MMTKSKKVKHQLGDIVQIKLEDGSFSFARVLEEPLMAFYDFKSDSIPNLSEIVEKPIIFRIWVMNRAVKSGRWGVIGNIGLEPELVLSPKFFNQGALNKNFTIIYNDDESPATREECENLERAAVWDPEHVEDRLRDHYAGVPNMWVESLKPK
jgi:hypothetical protein